MSTASVHRWWRRPSWAAVLAAMLLAPRATAAADFQLTPADAADAAIVVAEPVDDVRRFAAAELADHLELVLGLRLPAVEGEARCRSCFHVGRVAPGDEAPLAEEEARYAVTSEAVYLYGEDLIRVPGDGSPRGAVIGPGPLRYNRVGTLFAVYQFLEEQLGVRWLEPGAQGTVAPRRDELRLAPATGRWQSPFPYQRNLRSYAWRSAHEPAVYLPAAFEMTEAEGQQRRAELEVWLRRMRMGARTSLNYGHASHDWWERHGEAHPEWFALNGNGVRGPLHRDRPDRVKMCVSNPGVVTQSVVEWQAAEAGAPASLALCVGVNDGGGGGAAEYCHCDACRALDVQRPGEPFGEHLTDRYMDLANRALDAARDVRPDAVVTAYAYAVTRQPPRRVQLADGVILQFVTAMADPLADTRALYQQWQRMGSRQFMFRPNDLCVELGLPLGHEERIWRHQQVAVQAGAQGTDHDSVYGLWTGISGITYYVLARSHIDPERPFEHWEAEYAAAFGAAAGEVQAYLRHWRRKFEDTILPANGDERSDGGRGFLRWNGLGAVSSRIGGFYDEADFDVTDSLLAAAMRRDLDDGTRRQLKRLRLANRHNRLTFEAMAAVNTADTALIRRKASALLAFREGARDELRMNWRVLFGTQHQMGDATGITSLLIEPRIAARRSFEARRAPTPPTVDGHLDEELWAAARLPVGLVDNATAGAARTDATVSVAWDDAALYVGVACQEPLMDEVIESVSARDGAAWMDNAVEVFVDGASTGRDFHQLIVTSAGALLDGRMRDGAFSAGWDADLGTDADYAVSRQDAGWSLELRLTWRALEVDPPRSGDRLRFNITRDRNVAAPGQSEATALAPTFGGFHAPARFAALTLSP